MIDLSHGSCNAFEIFRSSGIIMHNVNYLLVHRNYN